MATYLEQSLAKLKEFEGCIPWMYLDTVGKVTVGVGLMLPDADAAQALPFHAGDSPAGAQQIAQEFARVAAMPPGKAASAYRVSNSLLLPQPAIDQHLSTVLQHFEAELKTRLPQYDHFPDPVKLALLDMAYNLGPAGLLHGFPHLIAAVEQGAWAQAAADCLRHGPSAARNAWTRQQFLLAAGIALQAEAESLLARLGRWLRQAWQSLFFRRAS
ncbi:MAG: hypothetical protein KGK08_00175 [Acidobacteriota bacterium]|nr:hypothetical protein [Acidobacteriota bacterium]